MEVKKLQIIENKYISHLLLLGAKGIISWAERLVRRFNHHLLVKIELHPPRPKKNIAVPLRGNERNSISQPSTESQYNPSHGTKI